MSLRRWLQTFSLLVFWGLLFAAFSGSTAVAVDFFLWVDPTIALLSSAAGRFFIITFIPAGVLVMLTMLLGRFFCGHICPMGTTLDVADKLFSPVYKNQVRSGSLRPLKYMTLIFMAIAAALGVSFVFLASPLSLITRFYGLIILPLLVLLSDTGHQLLSPIWELLDVNSLLFLQIKPLRFSTQYFVFILFIVLFALSRLTLRFWCRYICPAGALLALFSRKPLVRRQVNSRCNDCKKCVRVCSMAAIDHETPAQTRYEDCIVCLECERICPESAITFARKGESGQGIKPAFPSRRQFITAGAAGAGTALLSLTSLGVPTGTPGEGDVAPPMLIRPPAALPEPEFLAQCVRCGECMVACPTNTLQPIWFNAGFTGLFSPAMVLRRAYCQPDCHRCAEVCPTNAIRLVPTADRIHAKTGTAVINRDRCIAWEQDQQCVVCDEVCPFGAIDLYREEGISVSIPKVKENKCSGCGYCEYHCPVQNRSAIRVNPMDAIRISGGSFQQEAARRGITISREEQTPSGYPGQGRSDEPAPGFDLSTAPGFESDNSGGEQSAPGFLEEE